MHYQKKARRSYLIIRTKAILFTILIHLLLLFGVLLSGGINIQEDFQEQIESWWKEDSIRP